MSSGSQCSTHNGRPDRSSKTNRASLVCAVALTALLSACSGGGSDDTTAALPAPAPSPPVTPTVVDWTDPQSVADYFEIARQAWVKHEGGGLDAVKAALIENSANPRYDYEAVKAGLLNLPEYQNVQHVDLNSEELINEGLKRAHPFTIANIHSALAAGLTGHNQTIAIVDNGFQIDHPALEGKNILCFGWSYSDQDTSANPADCGPQETYSNDKHPHGTTVSVIAAGKFSQGGVMGVAPDADLVLMKFMDVPEFYTFHHWDLFFSIAADKAIDNNAIAWNNSWSLPWYPDISDSEDEEIYREKFSKMAEILSRYSVDNPETENIDGDATGVLVWAPINDNFTSNTGPNGGHFGVLTDMPYIFTDLQEAWIKAVNVDVILDSDTGEISQVDRTSSACGYGAAWCLAGIGHMRIADAESGYLDNEFTFGTSYVAPQIAGGVALLAQAFPNLTPAEWTARLLVSANNRWFLKAGDPGYDTTVDLAKRCWSFTGSANPAVCHTYSREWGHGIMDMEAALLPIGGLRFLLGGTLTSSIGVSLDQAAVTSAAGSSLNLLAALGNEKIAVFDGLATDFSIRGSDIIRMKDEYEDNSLLDRLSGGGPQGQHEFEQGGFSFASSKTYENGMPTTFRMTSAPSATGTYYGLGYTSQNVVAEIGGIEANAIAGPIGFASLMDDMGYATVGQKISAMSAVELFGFSGTNLNNTEGTIAGLGGRLRFGNPTTAFQLSGSFAAETGSFMGVTGHEDLWFGPRTSIGATGISFQHSLGNGYQLGGRAELGLAAQNQPGSLIHKAESTYYTGYTIDLEKQALLADTDRLNLWVKQPMRVEQSKVTFRLPSGRTKDGQLLYRYHEADMAPQSRQLDLGLSYAFDVPQSGGQAQIGLVHSLNHNHKTGESNTALAARYKLLF